MNIYKIVLTGGPCAGKTTVLEYVKDFIKNKKNDDFNLITVSESATELIKSGIFPRDFKRMYDFQDIIFEYQKAKESSECRGITNKNKDYVILYDRALIDNKAYLDSQDEFDCLLKKYDCREIDLLDSYDLLIDLVSVANCDEKKYSTLSNDARYESLEDAKISDIKTSNAWLGHRNYFSINSDVSMEEEANDIIKLIDDFITNKKSYDSKKMMVVFKEGKEKEFFKKYNINNSKIIDVEEMHLNVSYCDSVIFKRTYNNSTSFTIKVSENDKVVLDKKIDVDEVINMITKYGVKDIKKREEFHFFENKQAYKIYKENEQTYLEFVPNINNKDLIIPDEFNVIKLEDKLKEEKEIVKMLKKC